MPSLTSSAAFNPPSFSGVLYVLYLHFYQYNETGINEVLHFARYSDSIWHRHIRLSQQPEKLGKRDLVGPQKRLSVWLLGWHIGHEGPVVASREVGMLC